ncbi:MAG: FAD-binding domain-containing protein [Nostoc sp.]|uniref:FAD-binding domain-containing protein n=1 Tax=Nostoc sp. TaxID=1180 RepID=UPI002FFA0C7C
MYFLYSLNVCAGWHDSFTQRLYFYPEIAYKNRYPEFDEWYTPLEFPPQKQELFHAWQEGLTGFPLVDASMRQLKTGLTQLSQAMARLHRAARQTIKRQT